MKNTVIKIVGEKYYSNSGDKKSAAINSIKTAVRKMRRHLKLNGVQTNNVKEFVLIDTFAKMYGYEIPENKKQKKLWLVELYFSGSDDIVKRHINDQFYLSREWRELRLKVLNTYGYKCMKCGDELKQVHVDHIKPRSLYPNLELDFNNLQVLCPFCNLSKSNRNSVDYRKIC